MGVQDTEIPARRVRLGGKRNRNFLGASPEHVNQFFEVFPHESRTLVVWLAVLNECRAKKTTRVKFTRKWHSQLSMTRKTAVRCLRRLAEVGLLSVEIRQGASAWVSLAEHISYEL